MEIKFEKEKKDEEYLKLMNPQTCELAIKWLKEKLKNLGATITDEEEFDKRLNSHIARSWVTVGGKAVLSSAETLFNVCHRNGESLSEIFSSHGINIGDYIFSITITPLDVLVVDGKANARHKVEYNYEEKKFEYSGIRMFSTNNF